MSRKTPKSKSTAATAPKSKGRVPKSGAASTSKAKTKGKRASNSISVTDLADRVTALESGNSAFRHELKVLLVEINIISDFIKDKFGIELINKSSEVYKYIHDSKNDLKELTKKLSAVVPVPNCADKLQVQETLAPAPEKKGKERNQQQKQKETCNAHQDQDEGQNSFDIGAEKGVQRPDRESDSSTSSNKPQSNQDLHQQQSDNQESNNNERDKSDSTVKLEVGEVMVKATSSPNERSDEHEPSSSNSNTTAPRPDSPPSEPEPAPRPLTSFEKSRLAMYQRTLQERRKSNAAAAAAAASKESKFKEPPTNQQFSHSPPPPKITRIDTEPETSGNQHAVLEDDDGDGEPPNLEHSGEGAGGGAGAETETESGHFLEVIPSPGIGRLQKRGRCVLCSKKKVERKSRFWCGLCKKCLCQSPCYDEYHRSGGPASG